MTDLRATDPAQWRAAALDWRRRAAQAGTWVSDLRRCATRLASFWKGTAAEAATTALAAIVRRLTVFRLSCWAADQALCAFADALGRARLTADLPAARVADTTTARALDGLSLTAASPPPDLLPCTASAAQAHRWWQALTPAERSWLLATHPAMLGSLDGVPAADRDRANRLLLDDLRLPGPFEGDGLRAYLLAVDRSGDGRLVVAFGDPDRADAVLTHVPGMTASLATAPGELTRAERVAERATQLAPGRRTSAIMWLGYDAPDGITQAMSRESAEAGAGALRRFQEGLRITHEGPPARQTVLGHSYGSLVVGTAATAPGFAADGVVFVGSPGVGVDHAAQLAVPREEVWATTSDSDVIRRAAIPPVSPVDAGLRLLDPGRNLYHGTDPADPAFGARTVASQPDAGHIGYWERGRPALDALAMIALGRTDVTPR